MLHAQKFVLVPQERLEKLERSQETATLPTTQTPGDNASRTDAEMHKVLNSPGDDIEKAKIYAQLLARFLFQKGTMKNKIDVDTLLDLEDKSEPNDNFSVLSNITRDETVIYKKNLNAVISTVPRNFKTKAAGLLNHLLASGVVDWNEKYELVFQNKVITGTNIIDLVNDTLRNRKSVAPPSGRTIFAKALSQVHTPQEFIGNDDVKALADEQNPHLLLTPSPVKTRRQRAAATSTPKRSKRGSESEESFYDSANTSLNWDRIKHKKK